MEPLQHTQTSRLATLNVTHANIESHAKTLVKAPKTPYRNPNSIPKHKQKTQVFQQKNFSALILTSSHTKNTMQTPLRLTASKYIVQTPKPKLQPDTSGDWEPQAKHLDRSLDAHTPAPSTPSSMGALVPNTNLLPDPLVSGTAAYFQDGLRA